MANFSIIKPPEAIVSAQNLIRVTAPTDDKLALLEAYITMSGSTTSQQLKAQILKATTAGSGTTIVPQPLDDPDSSVPTGMSAARTFTTQPSLATHSLVERGFNALNGFSYVPTPSAQIIIDPGEFLVLRLDTAGSAGTYHAEMIVQVF